MEKEGLPDELPLDNEQEKLSEEGEEDGVDFNEYHKKARKELLEEYGDPPDLRRVAHIYRAGLVDAGYLSNFNTTQVIEIYKILAEEAGEVFHHPHESQRYLRLMSLLRPLPNDSQENLDEKESLRFDLGYVTTENQIDWYELKTKAQLMLNTIPAELKKRQELQELLWNTESQEEIQSVTEKIRELLRLRRGNVVSTEYLQKHPEDALNIHHTIDRVREYSMEIENMIGEGNQAWIYEDPERDDLCAKTIKDLSLAYKNNGNGPAQELSFLDELAEFEVDGVRTPFPYAYISDPGLHAIIMERLHAVSVGDLAKGATALTRAEEFDVDAFAASLFRYFNELHARNIVHNDPHEGNIMIDFDTHKPRVIDFGLSKRVMPLGDEEERLEQYKKADLGQLAKTVDLLRKWKASLLTNL